MEKCECVSCSSWNHMTCVTHRWISSLVHMFSCRIERIANSGNSIKSFLPEAKLHSLCKCNNVLGVNFCPVVAKRVKRMNPLPSSIASTGRKQRINASISGHAVPCDGSTFDHSLSFAFGANESIFLLHVHQYLVFVWVKNQIFPNMFTYLFASKRGTWKSAIGMRGESRCGGGGGCCCSCRTPALLTLSAAACGRLWYALQITRRQLLYGWSAAESVRMSIAFG